MKQFKRGLEPKRAMRLGPKKPINPHWFYINKTWYHCQVVQNGNIIKHYLNGVFTYEISLTKF